jgi:dissimilatory sulfite reductase (desulfoviridin) alpha/beta subunit
VGDQFALKNNQIFVLAEAAGGVYNSDQLRVLCEVADNESAFLKITEDQRIGFMVDPNKLAEVQTQVRKSGLLLRSYKSSGVPSPRACLGELCTFAHQPSLGDALELTTHLLKSFPSPKRFSTIGVNGCQRACLGSSTEDVHIVAEESGYKVSIGGKSSDIPQQAQLILENVQRADLPTVIEKLLAVFYQESQENERIFDVIERTGLTPFLNALPEHLVPVVSEPETDSLPVDDHTQATVNNLSAQLESPESSEPDSTDASAQNETTGDSIDDLLESSSQEFADFASPQADANAEPATAIADQIGNLELSEIEVPEVPADLSAEIPALEENTTVTDNTETDDLSDGLAGDLLEVAESDLEEGSLEDVERVRDAIRTELSMTPNNEQTLRPQVGGLLDELGDDENGQLTDQMSDATDALPEDELGSDEFSALSDDTSAETNLSGDTDHLNDFAQETAAGLEYSKPAAQHFQRMPPTGQTRKKQNAPQQQTQKMVGGRLSIRFEGTQLAVELPSGLSFDLPFESVADGTELSMSLPDGELRIQRDGQILAVNLGLLNLKIPIPEFDEQQVA